MFLKVRNVINFVLRRMLFPKRLKDFTGGFLYEDSNLLYALKICNTIYSLCDNFIKLYLFVLYN